MSGVQLRYCGVHMTKKGPRTFIVKNASQAPNNILEIQETTGDAPLLARELLRKYSPLLRATKTTEYVVAPDPLPPPTDLSHIGRVGVHTDGDAMHTAICVGIHRDECMLLFMTSHPWWNPYARLVTKDEAPFTGFNWNPVTFFAPVMRHPRNLHWKDRSLPDYRVEALREEFFKPEWLEPICRL